MAERRNPNEEKRKETVERVTLSVAFERFFEARNKLSPHTVSNYGRTAKLYLKAWRKKPMNQITRQMVLAKHQEIAKTHGEVTANNAMRHLRSVYNFIAATQDDFPPNPVLILSQARAWYRERRRQTLVTALDLPMWWKAVMAEPDYSRDFLLTALFTGMRRGELMKLRWDNVDLQARTLHRVLGKSEMRRLPTRCLVMETGNNLVLSGDVTRRALICRLDAGIERPDQRQFDFDPRHEAVSDRPRLVAAGLTILRAYIAAGRPNPMDRVGSFEQWNLVREALVWVGCADPALTRDRVLADDPQKEVLIDLLRLWRQALGDRQVTLIELTALAEHDAGGLVRKLVEELAANTRFHNGFNARSVGRFLAKHLDQIADGLALQAVNDASGIKRYRVVEARRRGEGAASIEAPF